MQINKKENMNVLCLQAFGLTPKMGRPSSSTRSSIAVAREQRTEKRSDGKESCEEVPRKSRLAASQLDFAVAATPRALVLQLSPALQRDPARRLGRKVRCNSVTTKYAVPDKIKLRILE